MQLRLLVCFINRKELLDEVLAKLIDLGVGGATVIDSTGIGRSKVEDIMLFEGFKDVLRGTEKNHFTVLCVVKQGKAAAMAKELSKVYGGFKEQGIGFFFTVPVDKAWGINL